MEEVTQSASIAATSDDFGSEVKGVDAIETKKEEGEGVAEEGDVKEDPSVEEEEDDEEDVLGEISPELQTLMQVLEAKTESSSEVEYLKTINLRRHYGQRIRAYYRLSDESETHDCEWPLGAQAELRLLQSIGSCKTLRKIAVDDLTENEIEALLKPVQSNPILEHLDISNYFGCYSEKIYEILGRILRASRTLEMLRLSLRVVTTKGACHLASGVRGNAESALRVLRMEAQWEESSVANQVAKIVRSAPTLEELCVWTGGVVTDEDGTDALGTALARNKSLKRLELHGLVRGAGATLLKAFTGEGSNKSIATLELIGVLEGIGDFLPLLLSANQSLKEFICHCYQSSPLLSASQWRSVGQALSSCSSLELFRIGGPWSSFRGEATDGGENVLSSLDIKDSCIGLFLNSNFYYPSEEEKGFLREVNTKNPIIELHLFYEDLRDSTTTWVSLAAALSSKGTQLSSLHLRMSRRHREERGEKEVDNFFQALQRSSTLQLLTIDGSHGVSWPGGRTKWLNCLRSNTTITHLRLIKRKNLDEDVFKQFMGVLLVNLTLKKISLDGTRWEPDGNKALIEEALRRNAQQDSYFSTFRRHGLPFQPATNGRLFLCGSPFAGKTQLRQTMARILQEKSWLGDKLAQLRRTRGVEMELLKDDEEMQIAVWDLAGQWIFRTLQDILFPRTNHTSIFLFVFSPYDRENRCMKTNVEQCLKEELEEWLRFIASNSQITWGMLPIVLVVISHMDKMGDRDVSWAKSIIADLVEEFKEILDVCGNLYQVNACKKKEVIPLKDFIFDSFRNLLRDKTYIAPKVCSQISSLLAKRTENIKYRPIWQAKDFYSFCFQNLQPKIDESLGPETASGLEVHKAMASYLHDTGSIIIVSSLDQIIVDPNWLTNVFLGELITMGHNFQVNSGANQRSKLALLSSKDGFVSSLDLHSLLSSFLDKHPKFRVLDINILKELLIHFDLCYKLDSKEINARYYIPSIVCEDTNSPGFARGWRTSTGSETLSWTSPLESNQFIGFRVECENPRRMSMTAALYPRFQIYMRQKLMTEMDLTADTVMCSRNYMRLHMDGHEILVERGDMAKSHIDILVKCSKNKSREIAVEYIEKHIIKELRIFCASPKGCPGISLVIGVLHTKCVEKLVPLACRGSNQAIPIRKLKDNFEAYIRTHVKDIKWSGSSSSLLNYEHYWPPIPDYLPSSFELALELLPKSEAEIVTKKVLERHEHDVKLVEQVLEEMTHVIDQTQGLPEVVAEVGKLSLALDVGDPSSSSTYTARRLHTSKSTFERVLSRIDHLEHKMEQRFDCLEVTLKQIQRNMDQIVTLQHQLQSSLSIFMSKLDIMIGYAESGERSRTPKRPYLSFENISVFQKVVAAMRVGTAVQLHFMCESMVGPHIVKDQIGLPLCLEKENMEWLRCIYDISFKMMYYLVKAGLHVTLGLGQAVPEVGSLEAVLPVSIASAAMDDIRTSDSLISVERSENMTLEAWSRLRSVLTPKMENNYAELFRLYRVKYLNLKEGGYAWVCEECMTRGIRNRSLEAL